MNDNKRGIAPSRHIVAVFTYVSLLPLVYFIPPWVVNNVTNNHLLATMLTLLIIVPLVSYISVPFLVGMFIWLRVAQFFERDGPDLNDNN